MIDQLPPRPDPTDERPRPNWWARAGLIAGIIAAFGAISIRAVVAGEGADPERLAELRSFPIETLVFAALALWLAFRGKEEAGETGRGKKLAWAGIVLGCLGLLVALSEFGRTLD